jgi:nitrogen regulatory protein PII
VNLAMDYTLICFIVDFGKGSKVIKLAKQAGLSGATVCLGKGTANNHILKLLDLTDVKKEIVFMIAKKANCDEAIEVITKKLRLDKPNHGIAFTIPVLNFLGARDCTYNKAMNESRGVYNKMYNAIFTIVEKGHAEGVIDAAVLAGSKGGTIINGRGSGIHETSKLFAMEIEPEKEIVLIIADTTSTDAIISSIRKHQKIDEPGKGILFVLPVEQTVGLY